MTYDVVHTVAKEVASTAWCPLALGTSVLYSVQCPPLFRHSIPHSVHLVSPTLSTWCPLLLAPVSCTLSSVPRSPDMVFLTLRSVPHSLHMVSLTLCKCPLLRAYGVPHPQNCNFSLPQGALNLCCYQSERQLEARTSSCTFPGNLRIAGLPYTSTLPLRMLHAQTCTAPSVVCACGQ